ncbi:MAG: DUF3298 domain-containing protein [Bacteroidia bacterium]|nr:DUF3298 domain-containing protein [Bacteroidia bacterium]
MKKSTLLSTIILFVIFFGTLFSCKKTAQTSTKIVFDSIVVKEQIPLLETNDTTLPFADVKMSFIYPIKFRNNEGLARLQQIFTGTFFNNLDLDSLLPKEAINAYISDYKEDYKSLSNDYYDEKNRLPKDETPMWYWYYMYHTNKIIFENDSLLSYAIEYSDYTGGAHGSHRITYINIDLDELVTVSEEDIFIPNYKKKLTDIIISQLMDQHNVTAPDSLINIGFFNLDEVFPNNNFWLSDKGIHYSYNQYEIAPYSMGVIDVDIPYEKLSAILKPDNVIQKFFPEREK